jgi:hypothetical protein
MKKITSDSETHRWPEGFRYTGFGPSPSINIAARAIAAVRRHRSRFERDPQRAHGPPKKGFDAARAQYNDLKRRATIGAQGVTTFSEDRSLIATRRSPPDANSHTTRRSKFLNMNLDSLPALGGPLPTRRSLAGAQTAAEETTRREAIASPRRRRSQNETEHTPLRSRTLDQALRAAPIDARADRWSTIPSGAEPWRSDATAGSSSSALHGWPSVEPHAVTGYSRRGEKMGFFFCARC